MPAPTLTPPKITLTDAPVSGWGMAATSRSKIAFPKSEADVRAAFELAREAKSTLAFRGSGCSYGDAAMNGGGILLDLREMNKIRSFNPDTGIIDVDAGVTIEQIWRHALPRGYWPPVVPGTMFPTLGGCAAMNIHGKNNFQVGTIGEHILDFDIVLPDGSTRQVSRESDPDLFFAAIGGFGMLGCMTRISLKLKKVHSGDLRVQPIATGSIAEMIAFFESEAPRSDYLVGWVDAFGEGRGLIHQAWYLKDGEDPAPEKTCVESHQDLPRRFFGIIPKTWMWTGLWFFLNRPGMRLVNAAKFHIGHRHARHPARLQSLVGFSFLLDYVPNWKLAYRPGGLIQYQSFVPKAAATDVFNGLLRLSREAGIMPYLGVLKKHRVDPFLMTHAVEGYSLALDFPCHKRNRRNLMALAERMDQVVLEGGGRFYFAKDSTMTPSTLVRAYPQQALDRFRAIKRDLDPLGTIQTDLSRRLGI